MSHTTVYNPAGNGQVEKYNGTVWKAITMSCKSKNFSIKYWQDVLPDDLHSIRSLLCTATNETPHERLFRFARRSTSGKAVPTWLTTPGPVFIKRHVRTSKTETLVDEVELLRANSNYAHIRYPDGRETTVSTKHLAPCGERIKNLLSQVSSQPAELLQTVSSSPTEPLRPVSVQLAESRQLNDSFEADFRTSGLDTQPDLDVATNEPEPITTSQNSFNQVKPVRRSGRSTNPPDRFKPSDHL